MWHGAMVGWMWLWGLLGLVALVVLVYLLVRMAAGGRPTGGAPDRSSPREILDARYARGDIGEDEYRRRRQALE